MAAAGNPRIFNNNLSADIPPLKEGDGTKPVPPVDDDGDDGTIFISIASYRDGERCAETLKSIFENANDPSKVYIGLIEQNAPEDKFCLDEYCSSFGSSILKKQQVRKDMWKVQLDPSKAESCPRYNQIRKVAFHHYSAKGPMYARSMTRKLLANEQYCMQIDAHSQFVKDWDVVAKSEWLATQNEFAILSTTPASSALKHEYGEGGAKHNMVPRNCEVMFRDNGFPDFVSPADAHAADLDKPILSHTYSSAFSFGKCHMEESAPNDPFALFAMPIEQFSRYARLWTRGYDTYTPSRNIVFHDYGKQPNGHGGNEWFKHQRDHSRKEALKRAKSVIQLFGGDPTVRAQANLGIYGLGKRRTIQQLMDYAKMKDIDRNGGNKGKIIDCIGHEWVPYDAAISPVENLFDKPDNLDPQPEYPLRTNLIFYRQVDKIMMPKIRVAMDKQGNAEVREGLRRRMPAGAADSANIEFEQQPTLPSFSLLFVFWIFGLIVWCAMFTNSSFVVASAAKKKGKKKKKKTSMAKDA